MKTHIFFHDFLKGMRKGKEVSLERISHGLCSVSMYARYESGERLPDKMMRDRFMERLGMEAEGYEDYLQAEEYERWKVRQDLLSAVAVKDIKTARDMIERYEREDKSQNAVERQFYLTMKAQICRYENASKEVLKDIFLKALECTVPNVEAGVWPGSLLAVKEWNLLLEYIHYGGDTGIAGAAAKNLNALQAEESRRTQMDTCRRSEYEFLLNEIKKADMDLFCNARIYPKTVVYLCMEKMKAPEEKWECEKLLSLCEEALEILRSAERMYYMAELLECMERLYVVYLARLRKALERAGEFYEAETAGLMGQQVAALDSRLAQIRKWHNVLEELCRNMSVSYHMENDCYFYWQSENYSIGDVVRRRRVLLGMSVKELSEGICDEKTIRRLEKGRTRVQMAIMVQLFQRLKLSPEYQRKDIVTDQYEALVIHRNLVDAVNNYEIEKFASLLQQLKNILNMDDLVNRQEIQKLDILHRFDEGCITKEECVGELRKLLEDYIPLENLDHIKDGYLTSGEIECLHSMATRMEGMENERYMKQLQSIGRQYEEEDMVKEHISIYELIMRSVASYLGDIGDYEQSDKIAERIMKECLVLSRLNMLHNCIYCLFWNKKEQAMQKGSAVPDYYAKQELQKCIQLARLCRETFYEEFCLDKLKQY